MYDGLLSTEIDDVEHPALWDGCMFAWAPCLGPTGLSILDWGPYRRSQVLNNFTLSSAWDVWRGFGGLKFDASNDWCQASGTRFSDADAVQSFSTWLSFASVASSPSQAILTLRDTAGSRAIQLYLASGTLRMFKWGGTLLVNSGITPSVDDLTHVAFVNDGSNRTIFVNGVQAATATTSLQPGTVETAIIGSWDIGPGDTPNCRLYDLRLYNRVLSTGDVRTLSTRPTIAYEAAVRRTIWESDATGRRRRLLCAGAV